MALSSRRGLAVAIIAASSVGCRSAKKHAPYDGVAHRADPPAHEVASSTASASSPLPPDGEALLVSSREIHLAVYLAQPATKAQLDSFEGSVRIALPGVKMGDPGAPPPFARVAAPPIAEFAPPEGSALAHFARRLDDAGRAALSASHGVVAVGLSLDADPRLERLRAAYRVVGDFAKQNHGTIWDEDTREAFDLASWEKERIEGWVGDVPNMRDQFTTHYYEDGGAYRAVTIGLGKFGLPDLAIPDAPIALSDRAGTLIVLVAQALLSGAQLKRGVLTLDTSKIAHPTLKAYVAKDVKPNAVGRTEVQLVPATPKEGDADNRLYEIRFGNRHERSETEREAAALVELLGNTDALLGAPADDPELAAIKTKVQAKLPSLRSALQAARLGDRIAVKAPFATDSGSVEWMWITVQSFDGGMVKGILDNTPDDVRSLKLGAHVEVKETAVADYLWRKPDGSTEGGESETVLERRDKEKR